MARTKDTYLNREGLEYYHSKIKQEFATKDEVAEKQDLLTEANAGLGIQITTDPSGNVIISSESQGISWGAIEGNITDQTDLINYVDQNGGKIDQIKVNSVTQPIVDKAVDITVPTRVSQLTNDSGFITKTVNDLTNYYLKTETYTKEEVNQLITPALTIQIVQQLPTQDISTTTIYLVPATSTGTNNYYDEYMYINNAWELLGTTQVDLSDYYTSEQVNTLLEGKQDILTAANAGTGISITTDPNTGDVIISSTQNSAEWGNITGTITDQTDLINYIDDNGGKIDTISVNNVQQTITNKNVNITVPTATSDLTNDSNFVSDASYVHTDNNFTTALKDKLDGIESGAEVNVQSDWSVSDSTSDAYIKNKPTNLTDFTNDGNFVQDASYVHTDNNFTTTLKNKLDGIAAGAEVNVQADWSVTDNTSDAYIQHKPQYITSVNKNPQESGNRTQALQFIIQLANGGAAAEMWRYDEVFAFHLYHPASYTDYIGYQIYESDTEVSSAFTRLLLAEGRHKTAILRIYAGSTFVPVADPIADGVAYFFKVTQASRNDGTFHFYGIDSRGQLYRYELRGVRATDSDPFEWTAKRYEAELQKTVTSQEVTTALGYTPYDSANPAGYITNSALSGYATETYVQNYHDSTKQDVLTAGNNIHIKDNVISTDSYVGGTDIEVVRGAELHSLPSGYTELRSVSNGANTRVDTGVGTIADGSLSTKIEMEIDFTCGTTSSNYLFQSRNSSNGTIFGISGSGTGGTIIAGWNGTSTSSSIIRVVGNTYRVKATFQDGTTTLTVLEKETSQTATNTGTYTYASPTTDFYLFGNAGGNYLATEGARIHEAKLTIDDNVVFHYIPASYNNQVGFYDLVSETFVVADVGGELIAGPTATSENVINFTNDTGYITSSYYSGTNGIAITPTRGGATIGLIEQLVFDCGTSTTVLYGG